MKTSLFAFALALLLSVGTAGWSQTTGDSPDPRAARIAHDVSYEIYSPFCPGKTLAMCPSAAAAEVRRDIQDMAEAGMTEDQIKKSILEEYGEEFRVVEPGIMDNVGPFGLLGGGLLIAIAAVYVFTRRRSAAEDAAADAKLSDADVSAESEDPYVAKLREQYRD